MGERDKLLWAPWAAVLVIPVAAIFSTWLAVLFTLVILFVAFLDDEALVCSSIVICGYHGILQLNDLNFFGSIIDVILSAIMLLRLAWLLFRGLRFPKTPILLFLPLFLGIIVSALLNAFERDLFYLGLVAKDFIAPLCAYFYFVLVFSNRESLKLSLNNVVRFFILGITVVGLMSLLNYVFVISESFSRFVLTASGLEEHAARRELAGMILVRMNSLFVLSTQGAASCLYALAMSIVVVGGKNVLRSQFLRSFVLVILILCGVISVSMTFWLTLLIFLILYYTAWVIREKRIKAVSFILISIFLVVSSVLISSLTLKTKIKDLSLISYGYDSFLAPSIERVFSNEISSIFIGIGPYPKLYLQQLYGTPEHNQLFKLVYDNWLFGIVFQLGVFVAGFFFLVLVKVFNMISNKAVSEERLVLGVAFISLIGFSHGTFIIDRLFIMKATFLLAACVVRPNELNRG